MQNAPPKPLLIQMSGAPGAGKSTTARLLRHSMHGVVIDHDVLRSSMLESGIVSFHQAAKQAYHLQWRLARDMMEQGLSVIVDSPCNYPEVLTQGSALAARYGYGYWYVECVVEDVGLLDRRLRARSDGGVMISQRTGVDRPPAALQEALAATATATAITAAVTEEDSTAIVTKWIKTPCRPDQNIVVVDSTLTPDVIRDQILEQIVGSQI